MTRIVAVLLKRHLTACWAEVVPYSMCYLLFDDRATCFESHLDSLTKDMGDLRINFNLIVHHKIRILGPNTARNDQKVYAH